VVTGDEPGGATVVMPGEDPATWGFDRRVEPPLGMDPHAPVNDPDPIPMD
jgi:hypothetical protein